VVGPNDHFITVIIICYTTWLKTEHGYKKQLGLQFALFLVCGLKDEKLILKANLHEN